MAVSALGQKYDQATNQLAAIQQQIAQTRSKIASDRQLVGLDKVHLRRAVINSYVTDGAATGPNPLFSANQKTYAAAQEYGSVAAGNLNVAVANLHTDEVALGIATIKLTTQQSAAQAAVNAAAAARSAADSQQAALESSLSQVQGQLGVLERAAQVGSNASEGAVTRSRLAASANFPPPPTNSAGGRAVAAAESQIGVPYVWGGESPGRGFDCSGLVAWAWGQAGVSLPHFSGAQMSDSAPVPVSDLQPGDLLFYGPGGDNHVAMYVGGGEMIEAPYTGASVWITALRLGDGFAGAGRP
jgi:cell wall-associated NlpC family hydrolase